MLSSQFSLLWTWDPPLVTLLQGRSDEKGISAYITSRCPSTFAATDGRSLRERRGTSLSGKPVPALQLLERLLQTKFS
jgi:hypothetical protein